MAHLGRERVTKPAAELEDPSPDRNPLLAGFTDWLPIGWDGSAACTSCGAE